MVPPANNHHEEIEAGEIDMDSRPYRKRDADELYSGRSRSNRDTEDDPFAEYERLSRSVRRNSDYEEKRYRSAYYSSGRPRHSRDYESNNKDKRDKKPYVSNRGDNNNHRRSRSPITRNRTSENKYATTITDQDQR
jgi:hypothetical protein